VAVIGRSRQGAADCNDRHTWPSLPSPALSHQGSYLGLSCRLERRRRTIIVNGATQTMPDWSAWSQEAVRLMQERNDAWIRRYGLEGRRYQRSLDEAQLRFTSESDEVTCDICVIGSVSRSEGTFSWAWSNETIPSCARRGLASVRDFGETHALEFLISPQWPGSRPEGLEMAAVAGRVLDADGVWIAETGDLTLFFALSNFRRHPGE
jgi:hypothetical protein